MNAIQNMPLFHEITATEHRHGADDAWGREAGELAGKLRSWLNGSRCVLVFTGDDFFHHDSYSGDIVCSFFINGHEVLVLDPEEITLELLSAAYISEPQYYLKTGAPADAVQGMLQNCLKNESEEIWRDGDFDELALHRAFGDFIMVFHWWKEHRIAREEDIIAHNDEIQARLAAERAKPLWLKVSGGMRAALFVLGCLTLVVPLFFLARRLKALLMGTSEA